MGKINYQGDKASEVFSGNGRGNAVKLFYAESADLFAYVIKENIKPGNYTLADLGGHKGEFLSQIINKLPDYSFDSVVVDVTEDNVGSQTQFRKIQRDIRNTGFLDKSIDFVIMRYVLAWNAFVDQKSILEEISRICRCICIIQHQGADSLDPKPLQTAAEKIFNGEVISKLKRDNGFFTESRIIEKWMGEIGINYTKIQERRIETLSELFIEKFDLSDEESQKVRNALASCDYMMQSCYVLDFRDSL